MNSRSSIILIVIGLAVMFLSLSFQFITVNDSIVTRESLAALHAVPPFAFMVWGAIVLASGWARLKKPSKCVLFALGVSSFIALVFIVLFYESILTYSSSNLLVPIYLSIDALTPMLVSVLALVYSKLYER